MGLPKPNTYGGIEGIQVIGTYQTNLYGNNLADLPSVEGFNCCLVKKLAFLIIQKIANPYHVFIIGFRVEKFPTEFGIQKPIVIDRYLVFSFFREKNGVGD